MKYPDDYINKIINGDCLEVMKQMPDKCVDLVLTDPPYGLGFQYEQFTDTQDNLKNLVNKYLFINIIVENLFSIPKIHYLILDILLTRNVFTGELL